MISFLLCIFSFVSLALTTYSTEGSPLKWPPSCRFQCNFLIFHSLMLFWAFDFLPLEMAWHLGWCRLLILLAHLLGLFLCTSFSPPALSVERSPENLISSLSFSYASVRGPDPHLWPYFEVSSSFPIDIFFFQSYDLKTRRWEGTSSVSFSFPP